MSSSLRVRIAGEHGGPLLLLVSLGIAGLLQPACSGAEQSRADDEIIAVSRVEVTESYPAEKGWRLRYWNRSDGPLTCTANVRWHEQHPPQPLVATTYATFELGPHATLDVIFERPTIIDDYQTFYAMVEVDRDGLFLECE